LFSSIVTENRFIITRLNKLMLFDSEITPRRPKTIRFFCLDGKVFKFKKGQISIIVFF
jgi:hypothetical protein